jgi:hypothetical protein
MLFMVLAKLPQHPKLKKSPGAVPGLRLCLLETSG